MRNNGIHVMAFTVPGLIVVLRHLWRQLLRVGVAVGVAYGLYVGPVFAVLKVQPGPQEESYSVPLQQLGRVVKYHWAALPSADQAFLTRTFAAVPPQVLADGYVPYLADPMKLTARRAWGNYSTTELLAAPLPIATCWHPAGPPRCWCPAPGATTRRPRTWSRPIAHSA